MALKQFKKWWDKHIKKDKLQRSDYFGGTKAGWIAALEWIHKNHCSGAFECGSELEDDIAKELGDD